MVVVGGRGGGERDGVINDFVKNVYVDKHCNNSSAIKFRISQIPQCFFVQCWNPPCMVIYSIIVPISQNAIHCI